MRFVIQMLQLIDVNEHVKFGNAFVIGFGACGDGHVVFGTGVAFHPGRGPRGGRKVRFFLEVLDESKVDIRFADMPDLDPRTDEGRMMLISLANFAEFEGRRISSRTKAALAVAKTKGTQLGKAGPDNLKQNIEERQAAANTFAKNLSHTFDGMKAAGLSQRGMVAALNASNTPTATGKGVWSLRQVQRCLERLACS